MRHFIGWISVYILILVEPGRWIFKTREPIRYVDRINGRSMSVKFIKLCHHTDQQRASPKCPERFDFITRRSDILYSCGVQRADPLNRDP